jgi:hypothetical protein
LSEKCFGDFDLAVADGRPPGDMSGFCETEPRPDRRIERTECIAQAPKRSAVTPHIFLSFLGPGHSERSGSNSTVFDPVKRYSNIVLAFFTLAWRRREQFQCLSDLLTSSHARIVASLAKSQTRAHGQTP